MRDLFQGASMFKDVLAAAVEANAETVKPDFLGDFIRHFEAEIESLRAEIKALQVGESMRRERWDGIANGSGIMTTPITPEGNNFTPNIIVSGVVGRPVSSEPYGLIYWSSSQGDGIWSVDDSFGVWHGC